MFYPVRTLEPRLQPYRVLTTTAPAGGSVLYEVDACKYLDAPALIFRQLVPDRGPTINLPSTTTNIPIGCAKSLSSILIPLDTPPGRYHLELTLSYQLFGGRSISARVQTDTFTIQPPTP